MSEIPTTVKNKDLVKKRREQIILAAVKLFSQKGYYKTSLRELAEESGISTGNIYDYVSSKEDIFYLIHSYMEKISAKRLRQSIAGITDPMDKLRRIVRAEFNVMDEWSDLILLLYQESHILSPPFLHKLLATEREHLEKIEVVIQECMEKGYLRECNVRVVANLIKSMIDTWVVKRWDLRGHSTRLETEKEILELVLNGLLKGDKVASDEAALAGAFEGKHILFVNGSSWLGTSICAFLLHQGAHLTIHSGKLIAGRESPELSEDLFANAKIYSSQEHGPMSPELFQLIQQEQGPVDIYMQDLGVGNLKRNSRSGADPEVATCLDANLNCATEIASYFIKQISGLSVRRIVLISPWAWDRHAERIHYEIVSSGVSALTRDLAANLAPNGVIVNSIVPGYIRATRPSRLEQSLMAELNNDIPLGHMGEIQDVTDALSYLAGDASKYVTGQEIKINGGLN